MGYEGISNTPTPNSEIGKDNVIEGEEGLSHEIERAESDLRLETETFQANLGEVEQKKKSVDFGILRKNFEALKDIRNQHTGISSALGVSMIGTLFSMLPTTIATIAYVGTDLHSKLDKMGIVSYEQMTGGYGRGPYDGILGNILGGQSAVAVSLLVMLIGAKMVEGYRTEHVLTK